MAKRLKAPDLPAWLDAQLPFTRYMVEVSEGVNAHVMEQGEGRSVVMFHGNPTWGYLYRKVAAELASDPFRLIMPDLVGLGLSDRAPSRSQHNLANHSRWMGTLVGELEMEDAIVVIQDWGGPIGLLAMSQHPGLATGLVVMNTTIGPPKPGFKPTQFHRVFSSPAGELLSRWLGLPQRRLSYAQGDKSSIDRAVQRAYNYALRGKRDYEAVVGLLRMVPDNMDHPSVPLLVDAGDFATSFEGPIAIVWGDRDPVLGRLRRRVARQLPHAEMTATSAGHFLQEEVPREIAAAIRSVAAG